MAIPQVGQTKPYVDYQQGGDTGYDNNDAIQPFSNGEALRADDATQPLNRQEENLRRRTEVIRAAADGLKYVVDADREMVVCGPGLVSWNASTGVFTIGGGSAYLFVLPFLTPGNPSPSAGNPPVQSTLGTLFIPSTGAPSDGLTLTSKRHNYQGGDRISLQIVAGTGTSAVVSGDFDIVLTVQIGTSTWQDINDALDGTGIVTMSATGGIVMGDLSDANIGLFSSREFLAGNWDAEAHIINAAAVSAWFALNERAGAPTNNLTEGDTLCIWYDALIDGAGGGRRESLIEYGTPPGAYTNKAIVPTGALFNSREYPERLANAVPICKRVNSRLIFIGGKVLNDGASSVPFDGNVPAVSITYAGGAAWADGTTNPATTVEAQLDKIVTDLAGTAGAAKIGATAGPNWADSSASSAGSGLKDKVDNIVTSLAGTSGEARVGAAASTATYADGGTLTPASAHVKSKFEKLVGDVGATTGETRVGAAATTATFADALVLTPSTPSVKGKFEALVTALGGSGGGIKVGATTGGERTSTTVQGQLVDLDNKKASLANNNIFAVDQQFSGNVMILGELDISSDLAIKNGNASATTARVNTLTKVNTPKSWGRVTVTAGVPVLSDGFNVKSVTSNGLVITFPDAAPMSTANYSVIITILTWSGNDAASRLPVALLPATVTTTTTNFSITTLLSLTASGNALFDAASRDWSYSFAVFARQ